jgi:hypothetical protein
VPDVLPVLPLIANEPLGVDALSYAERSASASSPIGTRIRISTSLWPGAREELDTLGAPTHLAPALKEVCT